MGNGDSQENSQLVKCLSFKESHVTHLISRCPILENSPDFLGTIIIGAIFHGCTKKGILKITPQIRVLKGKGWGYYPQ